MATGGGDDDIETDAVPIGFSTEEDSKSRFEDEEYKKYIDFMPLHLKNNNCDILILHDESDKREVLKFRQQIQRDCFMTIGNAKRNPVVRIEQDIVDVSSMSLDNAFSKTLYIFLFATQSFCKCNINLHQGHSCLLKDLEENKWCVIPVYVEDKDTREKKGYELPMMLKSIKPINYWDANYYKGYVSELLDSKVDIFSQMEMDLEGKRESYFKSNREDLIKKSKVFCLSGSSMSNSLKHPIQEKGTGYGACSKESEFVRWHTPLRIHDPMANPQLSGSHSQSVACKISHNPESPQVNTTERAQNPASHKSTSNTNSSVVGGNHGPSQKKSYMCAYTSTVQGRSATSNEGRFNFQNITCELPNFKACAEPSHEGGGNDSRHQNPKGQIEPAQVEMSATMDSDNSGMSCPGKELAVYRQHHESHKTVLKLPATNAEEDEQETHVKTEVRDPYAVLTEVPAGPQEVLPKSLVDSSLTPELVSFSTATPPQILSQPGNIINSQCTEAAKTVISNGSRLYPSEEDILSLYSDFAERQRSYPYFLLWESL
ncbi:hypothetical protein PoB_001707800 [Plakobranchus ocellatus]|uniref:TIR domain-containing protein n=1 Tax=Plakobranchus ocellatus TaxID=259542 RepID=A0AAV3Z785_9GAST|nr:hypothetical protein PoB_001707800 [Plakobranchus ocellatus]